STPLFMFILSFLIIRERLTWNLFVSMFLSMIGVLWILTQGSLERLLGLEFNVGDLIMIVAVILWALYSIVIKKTDGAMTSLAIFGFGTIIGTLFLMPLSIIELSVVSIEKIGLGEVLGFL